MTEQVADAGSTNTDTSMSDQAVSDAAGSDQEGLGTTAAEEGDSSQTVTTDDQQPVVPEEYTFEAPDGGEVDTDLINALTPALKEAGLTQEQAGKLFSAYSEHLNARTGVEDNEIQQAAQEWESQLKKDEEFGGEKFDENVGQVREFIEATVPESIKADLFQVFRDTGIGSHPSLVKYLHHMAKTFPVSEDAPIRGNGSNIATSKSTEQRMYGTD